MYRTAKRSLKQRRNPAAHLLVIECQTNLWHRQGLAFGSSLYLRLSNTYSDKTITAPDGASIATSEPALLGFAAADWQRLFSSQELSIDKFEGEHYDSIPQSCFFSFGAAVAALSALTLLASPTATPAAAALVQVTNTTANPAITQNTSKQAGELIHLHANVPPTIVAVVPMSFTSISAGLGSTANYSVPNNQTLVLTSIGIIPLGCPASPISTIDLFNNIGTVKA